MCSLLPEDLPAEFVLHVHLHGFGAIFMREMKAIHMKFSVTYYVTSILKAKCNSRFDVTYYPSYA